MSEPLHEWQKRMKREMGVEVGTHVWRKCFRKHRHETEGKARAAARSMGNRYNIPQDVYHCLRCGGWHTKTLAEREENADE